MRVLSRDGTHDAFESMNLGFIIVEATAFLTEKIKQAGIEFYLEITEDDILLECQHIQLGQVIMNLVSNAMEAVGDSSEKWIEIKTQKFESTCQIVVSDSGPGVPAEIRDKIMMPFFTTKPVGKGTGLGLSIVKSIVDHHCGQFFLDTDSPHTSFVVRLPLKQPLARPKAADSLKVA